LVRVDLIGNGLLVEEIRSKSDGFKSDDDVDKEDKFVGDELVERVSGSLLLLLLLLFYIKFTCIQPNQIKTSYKYIEI